MNLGQGHSRSSAQPNLGGFDTLGNRCRDQCIDPLREIKHMIVVMLGICNCVGRGEVLTLVVMQYHLSAARLADGCRYLVMVNRQPGHQGNFGQADGYPDIGKKTEPLE